MGKKNFQKDLEISKETDKEVIELINRFLSTNELFKNVNYECLGLHDGKEYDLLYRIGDSLKKFEVKEDFKCEFTGNVAVEYECRGKLSGISVSTAEYYIYKIHEEKNKIVHLLIPTIELKKSIDNIMYFDKRTGGDTGSFTKFYLFKLEDFKKIKHIVLS